MNEPTSTTPRYRVATFKEAGLEAKWSKLPTGAPIILARLPGTQVWWIMNVSTWDRMKRRGIMTGFQEATLLGEYFSI